MQKSDGALDHLDIRSLRMLSLLLETRSVTRTADMLGISQPAASRALAQLRRAAGDPLLVRAGSAQVLTQRAEQLQPAVENALAAIRAVFAPPGFDPARASGRIRMATTDYGALVVAVGLVVRLARDAPGLDLELQNWTPDTFDRLAEGSLDMALYADASLPAGFAHLELFRETYAALMRQGHPLLHGLAEGAALAPAALAAWPQAVVQYPEGRRMLSDDIVSQPGGPPVRMPFRTPFFLVAEGVIGATDQVMCLPARAARHLARQPGLVAVPVATVPGFAFRLIWHCRLDDDPRLRWLVGAVAATVQAATGGG